ncbi:MAG TPA: VOC family protein [Candidatus Dormibacteraeota bacterium]|nr:VOC family protein [Candidatus Dormibacteraeota bacterium]
MSSAPIAISHLDHVELTVPDLALAVDFYTRALGLALTGEIDGCVWLSVRPGAAAIVPRHDVVVREESRAALHHVAFGCPDPTALERTLAEVQRRGVAVEPADGDGARLRDPAGTLVELVVARPLVPRPPGAAPFEAVKLGHVTMQSPDPCEQEEFWRTRLGFRLSDQIGHDFYWLRCNRDHHTIAFSRGEPAGPHHVALELGSWEDIKLACDHLAGQGCPIEFGPCRHGPGNNVAIYVRDPFGMRWELFSELERIDDDEAWTPRRWEGGRQNTVNLWGPRPSESYYR